MNRNLFTAFYLFIAILIAACAKVSTPSGGARDRIPPVAVESIPEGFESIETDSRYIGVRLGIESGANYKLDARTSYGELKFDENNFSHQQRIVNNTSSEITGIVGSDSSPLAKVYVRSSYGSVKLY